MESVLSFDELKDEIEKGIKGQSVLDIKSILDRFLNRQDIDLITRIKENELDRICNMLHHTHKISLLKVRRLAVYEDIKTIDDNYIKNNMCTGEIYVLQNLSLRLSLDSQSREELVNIFVSVIKTELENIIKTKSEDSKKE